MRSVYGHCPMGCGGTLFLGDGGFITCSYIHCPNPTAVSDLLEDRENDCILRHPLRERLHDELETCELLERMTNLDGPPRTPGRYRVTMAAAGWLWTALA